jgi:hypothetical protein
MNLFSRLFGKLGTSRASATVEALRFDTSSWHEQEISDDRAVWINESGDLLALEVVPDSVNVPPLWNEAQLRWYCRQVADAEGAGIVAVDGMDLGPVSAVQFIFKRECGSGYVYKGMMVIPTAQVQYVFCVVCAESGTTGVREALVTARLVEAGKLQLELSEESDASGAIGKIAGWFQDPYDPTYDGKVVRSIADEEQYDSLVPDHPLSRLRRYLLQIRGTLQIDNAVLGNPG